MNFFKKLKESLKKTSEKFTKGIDEVFNKSKPQAEILLLCVISERGLV